MPKLYYRGQGMRIGYKKKVRFSSPYLLGGNKYSRGKYGKRSRKTNARGRYMGRKLNRRG